MATPDVHYADHVFNGTVSFGAPPNLPAGCIGDAEIESGAQIDASKLNTHRTETKEIAAINVEPTSTQYLVLHMAQAAGGVVGFTAAITGVLPATTGVCTVNLYKSTAGSTFASVLSAAILLDSADSLLVANTGTLSATTMASGDIFAVKATVATTSALRGVSCAFKYYERYV